MPRELEVSAWHAELLAQIARLSEQVRQLAPTGRWPGWEHRLQAGLGQR